MANRKKACSPQISSLLFLVSIVACWMIFAYQIPIKRQMIAISSDMLMVHGIDLLVKSTFACLSYQQTFAYAQMLWIDLTLSTMDQAHK